MSPKHPDQPLGPPSLEIDGYRCSFPRAKRLGREVDHSLTSSVEFKGKNTHTAERSGQQLVI